MKTLLEAMATMEGFYKEGTLAQRRNNPLNIEEGAWAQSNEALPSDGNRFAAWINPAAGFDAARLLLLDNYLGLSIPAVIAKWAPPSENNDTSYADGVYEMTGLSATDILTVSNIG
jgi:hypothetical protein